MVNRYLAVGVALLGLSFGSSYSLAQTKPAPKMDINDLIRPDAAKGISDSITESVSPPAPQNTGGPAKAVSSGQENSVPPVVQAIPNAAVDAPAEAAPRKRAVKVEPASVTNDPLTMPPVQANLVEHPQEPPKPVGPPLVLKQDITVTPGVNEIVPIAINHPNRLETPFKVVSIRTLADQQTATIKTDGNVIYASTNAKTPLTLFAMEKGTQSPALSLTLLAYEVPPQSVRLHVPDDVTLALPHSPTSPDQTSNAASSHSEEISDAFRAIAVGDVPQGFTFRQIAPSDILPGCGTPPGVSISFRPGQIFVGASSDIFVGIATNSGDRPVELKEKWCVTDRTSAVAFWPEVEISPNQSTEVYVMRVPNKRMGLQQRPSLLGGGQR